MTLDTLPPLIPLRSPTMPPFRFRHVMFLLLAGLGVGGITTTVAMTRPAQTVEEDPVEVAPPVAPAAPIVPAIVEPVVVEPVVDAVAKSAAPAACACETNGDIATFCPGVFETQGKTAQVKCLDAAAVSAGCRDSIDYAAGLNTTVLTACAAEKKLWCTTGPVLGAEVCFDGMRSHAATNSGGCNDSLAEHDAHQAEVKACSGKARR